MINSQTCSLINFITFILHELALANGMNAHNITTRAYSRTYHRKKKDAKGTVHIRSAKSAYIHNTMLALYTSRIDHFLRVYATFVVCVLSNLVAFDA